MQRGAWYDRGVSLDQIRYFVAVAEAGTTRAAAKALHVSQPPLSRQIRALEEEVGAPLFQRASTGMRLLPAGRRFYERATHILSQVELLRSEAIEPVTVQRRETSSESNVTG